VVVYRAASEPPSGTLGGSALHGVLHGLPRGFLAGDANVVARVATGAHATRDCY